MTSSFLYPNLIFQLFKSESGQLNKTISLVDGKLIKKASPPMTAGTAKAITPPSMQSLAELLDTLKPNEAIALSNSRFAKPQRIVTKAKLPENQGAIARTADYFGFVPKQPAIFLFDVENSGRNHSISDSLHALSEVIGDLKDLAMVVTQSSSAFVYSRTTGEQLSTGANHHIYLVAKDASDIARFAKALEGRLWLAGYGRSFIDRTGKFHPRTIIDGTVFRPERLIFEACPTFTGDLERRSPAPTWQEGSYLDTAVFPSLNDAESEAMLALQDVARSAARVEMARARSDYLAGAVQQLTSRGTETGRAMAIVESRLAGTLTDDDILYFDHLRGRSITVGEVLADPLVFDGKTLADPAEPDYQTSAGSINPGKAKFYANQVDGRPCINSYAHGGQTYFFRQSGAQEFANEAGPDDPYYTKEDFTDLGFVNMLRAQTDGDMRYLSAAKLWIYWTGEKWVEDRARTWTRAAIEKVAHGLSVKADKVRREAEEETDEARKKLLTRQVAALLGGEKRCRSQAGVKAILGLAETHGELVLPEENLNRHRDLLGVDNGVIDLRTGVLRPDSRDEYITQRCPIPYDPKAVAPEWDKFVEQITAVPFQQPGSVAGYKPRPDLVSYLQTAAGYWITGEVSQQKFFIFIGSGSNGKSVLIETASEVLGRPLATVVDPATMLETGRGVQDAQRATPATMQFRGARMAITSELKPGQKLDIGVVKRHTGDQTMTGRHLHGGQEEWDITHKVLLMTNHMPQMDHVDEAIKGRLHIIPFDMRWNRPGHSDRNASLPDGDPQLREKLKKEMPGILRWLVEGAVMFYRQGRLDPPGEVTRATNSYLHSQDPIAKWLASMGRCPARQGVLAATAFEAFNRWQEDEEDRTDITQAFFSRQLNSRLIERVKMNDGMHYGLVAMDRELESRDETVTG